jgi:hypothetical protein
MQRLRRPVFAILSLWFALYASVPQLLHYCPDHSPLSATRVAASISSHDHHGAPATAGDSDERQVSDECCCPGPSCGTSAVLVGDVRASTAAIVLDDVLLVGETVGNIAPAPVPHLLPFATAPPAV